MNNIGNNHSNFSQLLGNFLTNGVVSNEFEQRNAIDTSSDVSLQHVSGPVYYDYEWTNNFMNYPQYPQVNPLGGNTFLGGMMNLSFPQSDGYFQNSKPLSPNSLGFPIPCQFPLMDFLGHFNPLNPMNLTQSKFNRSASISVPQILNCIQEHGNNYLSNNLNSIEGNQFNEKRQRPHDEEEDLGKTKASVSRLPSTKDAVNESNNELLKLFLSSQKMAFPNKNQVYDKEEHNVGQSEEAREIVKSKFFRCTFKDCDKVFPKECNLKDHIRTHTGEKPYQCSCPGCDKRFSQHGNLKKHEKVHVGNKKYFCDYPHCGKKFSASYNLKIHYRCHTGERPYKCIFENCGKSFYDKGNLKYHEKTAHTVELINFPFSCDHMGCNIKFKTKKQKLIHHNKMEPECQIERNLLIKLLRKYKQLLKFIVKSNNIDVEKVEAMTSLKSFYEEIQSKLLDRDYFQSMLGESFESGCEEIECRDEGKEDEKLC